MLNLPKQRFNIPKSTIQKVKSTITSLNSGIVKKILHNQHHIICWCQYDEFDQMYFNMMEFPMLQILNLFTSLFQNALIRCYYCNECQSRY